MDKRITWGGFSEFILARNDKGEKLGHLKYERVGKHYHWHWYQYTFIRMSPGCLQEVRDKQKELFNQKPYKHRTGGFSKNG